MGSQLNKNYDVAKAPFGRTGLSNCWQLFSATKRDKSRSPVTIFFAEKKTFPKQQVEKSIAILKEEPNTLSRLKHPYVLRLLELPIEDNKIIAFATEPVECTLADLFKNPTRRSEIIPSELELKANLMELCNAVAFLHQTARIVHNCINLDHIFFTRDRKLKLGGFYFSKQSTSDVDSIEIPLDFSPQPKGVPIMLPDLRFTAPEVVKESKASMLSDLFSLGCVLYSAASLRSVKMETPYFLQLQDDMAQNKSAYLATIKRFETNPSEISSALDQQVGKDAALKNLLNKLLQIGYPENRGRVSDIATEQWFQDPFLKTINYLEHLQEKENSQKVQFLNGLQRIILKFEPYIIRRKLLPKLLFTIRQEPQLSVNVMPILVNLLEDGLPPGEKSAILGNASDAQNQIQSMGKKEEKKKQTPAITDNQFKSMVWPLIVNLCTGNEMPANTLYLIIKNTELWLYYLRNDSAQFEKFLFPLYLKAIDCKVPKLVQATLSKTSKISKKILLITLKSQLLPRLLHVVAQSQSLDLKCLALGCLRDIIPILDKRCLTDTVLEGINKIAKKVSDGKISMLVVQTCEQLGKMLGAQSLAHKILPSLTPLLVSANLTKDEFERVIRIVRMMLDEVERYRIKDLTGNEVQEQSNSVMAALDPASQNQRPKPQSELGFFEDIEGSGKKNEEAKKGPMSMFEKPQSYLSEISSKMPWEVQKPQTEINKPEPMPWEMPTPASATIAPARTSTTSANLFQNLNFSKPQTSDPFPPPAPIKPVSAAQSNPFEPMVPTNHPTPGSLASMKDDPFAGLGIQQPPSSGSFQPTFGIEAPSSSVPQFGFNNPAPASSAPSFPNFPIQNSAPPSQTLSFGTNPADPFGAFPPATTSSGMGGTGSQIGGFNQFQFPNNPQPQQSTVFNFGGMTQQPAPSFDLFSQNNPTGGLDSLFGGNNQSQKSNSQFPDLLS